MMRTVVGTNHLPNSHFLFFHFHSHIQNIRQVHLYVVSNGKIVPQIAYLILSFFLFVADNHFPVTRNKNNNP